MIFKTKKRYFGVYYGYQLWRTKRVLHRDKGPAIIYANGEKSWYHNGKKTWYHDGKLINDI